VITLAAFAGLVAGLIALLLWSGGERPSWGDNSDDGEPERRRHKDGDDPSGGHNDD
jgi:hypothetical protein